MSNLLKLEPKLRPSAAEAMQDEWITKHTAQDAVNQLEKKEQQKRIMMGGARGTTFQKYLAMQKLKKAALVTIAKNLTHDEVGSLQDIFRQEDQSCEGMLSLTELNDAMSVGTYIFLPAPQQQLLFTVILENTLRIILKMEMVCVWCVPMPKANYRQRLSRKSTP